MTKRGKYPGDAEMRGGEMTRRENVEEYVQG